MWGLTVRTHPSFLFEDASLTLFYFYFLSQRGRKNLNKGSHLYGGEAPQLQIQLSTYLLPLILISFVSFFHSGDKPEEH